MISPFASLLLASGAFLTAQAAEYNKWECQQTDSYPYCTHVQSENAPDGGAWPVMCFLPGSGARGSMDNAASLAGYDGHGKLVSEYLGGNKDETHSQAAEQFLTVVPIQADGTRHFDPDKVADIISEVQNNFNVDSSRIYISGYSMGARGTHRSLTFHPEIWAAGAPSAGAAEDSNADTLQQAYAPQDFNKLQAEVGIPVWSFAGQNDNTAGVDGSEATEKEVKSLGGNEFKLTVVPGADHSAMNIKPWTDYDLLTWFLQQSKNGATSSGAASASGGGGASASGVASAPASTATDSSSGPGTGEASGSSDDDDEDEDCDEDEDEGDDDEDEDCDEDEDEDDDDEEDCDDDEDEGSDESSSGNSQQQQPSGSGQATGSGQSDSNYGSPSGSGQATGSGQSDSNYGTPSGSGQATGSGQSDSNYGQASGSGQATGSGQSDSNYGTPSGSGSASEGGSGSGSGSGSSGTSSASGSSASGSASSDEDCDDSRLNRLRRRAATPEAPHIMERQAHHHVFSHSKRNWEVPLDSSMQHLAARQATSQDKAHRRALAKRSASSAPHGHGSFGRRSTAHGGHRGMSRIVRR